MTTRHLAVTAAIAIAAFGAGHSARPDARPARPVVVGPAHVIERVAFPPERWISGTPNGACVVIQGEQYCELP